MVKYKIGLINLLIIIVSVFSCDSVSAIQHHKHMRQHEKSRGVRFMPGRELNDLI